MGPTISETDDGPIVTLPDDWSGSVSIDEVSDDAFLVRRRTEDGSVPPFAIQAGNRPILVEVQFGRSAVVPSRMEAIRHGYRESEYRADFYYLDILEEPQWIQITEDADESDMGIYHNIDAWEREGTLTPAEAEWAREQFE